MNVSYSSNHPHTRCGGLPDSPFDKNEHAVAGEQLCCSRPQTAGGQHLHSILSGLMRQPELGHSAMQPVGR